MNIKHLVLGLAAASIAAGGFSVSSYAAKEKPSPEQRAERLNKRFDTNADGKVSLEEMQAGALKVFAAYDSNGDGTVSREELRARRDALREARKEYRDTRGKSEPERAEAREKLKVLQVGTMPGAGGKRFRHVDTDKDRKLSKAELAAAVDKGFKRRDVNGDGFIDAADFTK